MNNTHKHIVDKEQLKSITDSWKDGDVFFWAYNEETYKSFGNKEVYWCKSSIGIVRGEHLEDTYWSDRSCTLNKGDVINKLEIKPVANLYELERVSDDYYKAMYNDEDWVDLSHANNSKQWYLRKGAVKSKEKMIKIAKRNAYIKYREIIRARQALVWELEKIISKELDCIGVDKGVDTSDVSYMDDEVEQWLDDIDNMFDQTGMSKELNIYKELKVEQLLKE